jgi:hypothetical protein
LLSFHCGISDGPKENASNKCVFYPDYSNLFFLSKESTGARTAIIEKYHIVTPKESKVLNYYFATHSLQTQNSL